MILWRKLKTEIRSQVMSMPAVAIYALLNITSAEAASSNCRPPKVTDSDVRQAESARQVRNITVMGSNDMVLHITYSGISFFEVGCNKYLTRTGDAAVKNIANFAAKDASRSHLLIVGHADTDGAAPANASRSEERALTAVAEFKKLGLSKNFISKGVGSTSALELNINAESKSINRRLEFFLGNSSDFLLIASGIKSPLEGKIVRKTIPTLSLDGLNTLSSAAVAALRNAGLLRHN